MAASRCSGRPAEGGDEQRGPAGVRPPRPRAAPRAAAARGRPRWTAAWGGTKTTTRTRASTGAGTAYQLAASRARDHEAAAAAAGATLSGWPSRSAARSSSVVVEQQPSAGHQGPRQGQPADDRGGRRAEAPRRAGSTLRQCQPQAGRPTPMAANAARIARTTRWVSSSGDGARALAVDLDDQARRRSPRPRARRAGRGPGRGSRSPGRGWPRWPARRPAPARRRRSRRDQLEPGRLGGGVDVGVDHDVDDARRTPPARWRCP